MSYINRLYKKSDDMFLLIAYLKISCFIILRIYDIIKIIAMTCFLLNCGFKNDIFLRIHNVINNCDVMFFANCVFENDMFMYVLLYHFH